MTGVISLIVAGLFAFGVFQTSVTIRELLFENKRLKTAISNLTTAEQIGYAKVIRSEQKEGRTLTTLKFIYVFKISATGQVYPEVVPEL